MSEVTRLLEAAKAGDRLAADQLLPLVYEELRKLAAARMANERAGQTLDATALVHEAYLRLVGEQQFDGRGHFFAAAAEAMRRILIERARQRATLKRGGTIQRLPFDLDLFAAEDRPEDLLALDEALAKFEAVDPRAAQLVKLRFFTGLSIPKAAEAMNISPRTADAWWAFARSWLLASLQGEDLSLS